ncbi:hypothetical protein S2M10_08830 [Sphingomonas sp. S2M10]|uniref:class I SAM-dependent methyltransferase n=1 Tax=Sphingomonas sp. S2M10 TaxID=2705010 RepID=UPI0014575907|nr:hypothetical protein [Sphingomonas sp. S2M10]
MAPGTFIEPDLRLADSPDPNAALGIPVSHHHHYRYASHLAGRSSIFDSIIARLGQLDYPFDDQCTLQYYFDIVRVLRDFAGEFGRVVEVGTYMGGSSGFLAGCISRFDYDLDLIDIDARRLRSAYERVRRSFPESIHRVRIFHGDLPTYVARVLAQEESGKVLVHHDGSHSFNQVVKDMASLFFVRDKLLAVIAQDTNLRGGIHGDIFVDLALYAVFGSEVRYAPIGTACEAHEARTRPDPDTGLYFLPGVPEGVVIPMASNSFHYPHPHMTLAEILGDNQAASNTA